MNYFSNLKNNKNNNSDLNQGNLLIQKDKNHFNNIFSNFPLIQKTSSDNLDSIIETLNNNDSVKANSKNDNSKISLLEDEFNNTLVLYAQNYKLLTDELMKNNNNKILQKYAGNNIILADTNKQYYVNKYGFTHLYSVDASNNRPPSCMSKPIKISRDDFNKLPKGKDMPVGLDCGIAGYNIENKINGNHYWVEINGKIRAYEDNVWPSRSESCKNVPSKIVNVNNLVDFSSSSIVTDKMKTSSLCNRLNVDPALHENLIKLNEKLVTLGKQMLGEVNNQVQDDDTLNKKVKKTKEKISKQIQNLEKENKELKKSKYNYNLESLKKTTGLEVNSSYTKYLIWLVLSLLLIILTIHSLTAQKQSIVTQIIILIVALIILYYVFKYIYKKFF